MAHLRNSTGIALYALATLVVSGANFLTAPLLLRLLGTDGFADWARLEPIILLALPLAGFGLQLGLMNLIHDQPDAPGRLMPVHLGFTAGVAAAVAALVLAFFGPHIAFAAGMIVLVEGGIVFLIGYWRATNRPGWFAGFEGGRSASVMLVLLAMTLLPAVAVSEVTGYLALRAALGALFLGLALLMTRWRWKPDLPLARRAIGFGLPLVLSSMAVTLIMNFDRYAVDLVARSGGLAAYVAHVKVTQILGSALGPFFIWFAPVAIARLHVGTLHDGFFGRAFYAFSAVNFALGLGLWLVTPVLWSVLFPDIAYAPALMAPLVLGMVVFAAGNPLSVGALREGRTNRALLVTLFAALCGGLSLLVLAPAYGAQGVAWAKALGMLAYTAAFGLHTWRSLRIAYPWGRIGLLCALTVATAFLLTPVMLVVSPLIGTALTSLAAIGVLAVGWAIDRVFYGASQR